MTQTVDLALFDRWLCRGALHSSLDTEGRVADVAKQDAAAKGGAAKVVILTSVWQENVEGQQHSQNLRWLQRLLRLQNSRQCSTSAQNGS